MAKKQARKKAARGSAKTARPRRATQAAGGRTARKTAARTAAKKKTARGVSKRGAQKRAARGGSARGRARRATTRRAGAGRLSRSTRGAEWIESLEDRAARPGQTLATRSHEVIQRWAEERGGEPSTVPGADPEEPRVLRLNFPGFGGENLEPVTWEDWLGTFDDRKLVFVFQDRLKNGNQSNFFRLDSPEREDG